jgi:hypothetical protein
MRSITPDAERIHGLIPTLEGFDCMASSIERASAPRRTVVFTAAGGDHREASVEHLGTLSNRAG